MPGRFPGSKARFSGRTWSSQVGRDLDELLGKIFDGVKILETFPGLPKIIRAGIAAATGSGPAVALWDHQHAIETASPSHPTGPVALEGSGTALMRADATIQQGIVTTKGDLLGFSTVPERLPVGADGHLIVADSASALGLKWETPVTIFDAVANDNTRNFIRVTGTLPVTPITPVYGVLVNVTSAGSENFSQYGLLAQLSAGYVGNKSTISIYGLNNVNGGTSGAGTNDPGGGFVGNIGVRGLSSIAGTGSSIGVHGYAEGAGNNYGGVFNARFFSAGPNTHAIGVWCIGGNPTHDLAVGGVFALGSGEEAAVEDAVILGDSCHFVVPLLILKDRGTRVFSIEGGGGVRVKSAALGAVTLDNQNHVVRVDTSAGPVTVTLPAIAAENRGVWYRFKNEGANALTIAKTGGDTIDGAATQVLTNQYDSVDVIAPEAGSDWVLFGVGAAGGGGTTDDEARAMAFMAA